MTTGGNSRFNLRSRLAGEMLHTWVSLLAIPNVRWLVVARLLANVYFYSAVIVRFEFDRGLNFTQIFLLESVLSLAVLLLNIPTGVWADRWGYRTLLIVSHMLGALSVVVMLFAHGFLLFAIADVLFGAGIACASGCEDALLLHSIADSPDAASHGRAGSAFALRGAATSAGFFIGLVSGSLFAAHDPTIAVVATLAPAWLAVAVAFRLRSDATGASLDEHTSGEFGPRSTVYALLRGAARLIAQRPLLIALSLLESVAFACVNAIFWYNQPLLGRAGVATQWFGPLTALAVAFAILTAFLLPVVRRWVGRRWLFAVSLLAPGVAYLLLAQKHGAVLVVALIALVVGGSAWRTPLLSEAVNERIGDVGRATTLSALSFIGSFVGIGVNVLVGRAGDAGIAVVGAALGLALVILAGVALWLMPGGDMEPAKLS
ncbi:MAG TPA: MFS transporter [Ktedonobacterales bacterium]